MKFNEFKELHKEMDENTMADIEKVVQGETDAIRTEYSGKLKDLEQYKPHEKTETEIKLEEANSKLAQYEFGSKLKQQGLNSDFGQFLKSDVDLEAFKTLIGSNQSAEYIPSNHQTDVGLTKEQFKAMSYTEKSKLYTENPTLYQQITTNN